MFSSLVLYVPARDKFICGIWSVMVVSEICIGVGGYVDGWLGGRLGRLMGGCVGE